MEGARKKTSKHNTCTSSIRGAQGYKFTYIILQRNITSVIIEIVQAFLAAFALVTGKCLFLGFSVPKLLHNIYM